MPSHEQKKSDRKRSSVKREPLFKLSNNSLFARKKPHRESLKISQKVMRSLGIENMEAEDYIPSTADNPELVAVKPVNLLQEFGGCGLFAYVDIPTGTCLGVYTGEQYPTTTSFKKYLTETQGADYSYAMTMGYKVIDASLKGNFTRYINFSDTQDNVEFREGEVNGQKAVIVVTTKDIKAGQQVLVDYNCYDQKASELYFFLSPEDGWKSTSEVYKSNSRLYKLFVLDADLELFKLRKNEGLYVTRIGEAIFAGQKLSEVMKRFFEKEVGLPFLKLNPDGIFIDFDQADSFTGLMLAAYLGQLDNIKWLIANKANIDQQQNHSGNGALFFALEGYATAQPIKQKTYLNILCLLVSAQANLCVHDRQDRTFLHKASSILSEAHFKILIEHVKKQKHLDVAPLFSYINNENNDIVLSCLEQGDFAKVAVLLDLNPRYFTDNYFNPTKAARGDVKALLTIIERYDATEKKALLEILRDKVSNLPEFVKVLGLDTKLEQINFARFR